MLKGSLEGQSRQQHSCALFRNGKACADQTPNHALDCCIMVCSVSLVHIETLETAR